MSADVEVVIERHEKVLILPTSAIVDTGQGTFCWVKTPAGGSQRRTVQLGDISDTSIVVKAGLQEGEEVVLDPLASVAEARTLALEPPDQTASRASASRESHHVD
jgi:multidrug efflux pump subunit AcrA (membrane-fusion protein)